MTIQLTRKEMTALLYSLKGESKQPPLLIIEKAINFTSPSDINIPAFLIKASKRRNLQEFGLSTNEIVSLANLCELTSLKSTSIQNWIKRDVKELIGPPELGKKYSIDQAAMLLIVKDLKYVFDFEKIRKVLTEAFNTLSDRSDDLISPIMFYEMYGTILEKLEKLPFRGQTLEQQIVEEVNAIPKKFSELTESQWKTIERILVTTVLAVIASHLQTRAQVYLNESSINHEGHVY